MATGYASIKATGGIPPYSYLWSNGSTTATISNLAAGIYTVTVTDSYNCVLDTTFQIIQPDSGLSNNLNISQVTCFGLANGSITVTTMGGTPAYSYLWSNEQQLHH